jgi:pimeloyl-ACP methyl ester carboxylesterase
LNNSNALPSVDYDRIPYLIIFKEQAGFKDTYAGDIGIVTLKAHLLKPVGRPSDTVLIFMHPIGGGEYLPMPNALARAGHHVIYCNSRYPGVDYALIMEKVVLDLGACVRDARERLGYKKVVLAGWSGGGSLSSFYQAQAEHPTVERTPAGDPPDLTRAGLLPVDGLMLLAAHVARAHTLTEWMDASIQDESRPDLRDPEWNLYDPRNPHQPPYGAAYVAEYRLRQIARNRRITAWVKEKLADLKRRGQENAEFAFTVHGTMADPRWLDPAVDPNGRKPGWCFMGDPRVVNDSPVGLARYSSLRSWLSQWSFDDSNADGVKALSKVSVPVLVIGNLADDACTPSHTHRLFSAISHGDKRLAEIDGANHYYTGQKLELMQSVGVIATWLREHGFGP